jgi:hypothetical protein
VDSWGSHRAGPRRAGCGLKVVMVLRAFDTTSSRRRGMRTNGSDSFGFVAFPSADAAGAAALDFLERSRDVANEVVVDGTRSETSTLGREENIAPRSGPAV